MNIKSVVVDAPEDHPFDSVRVTWDSRGRLIVSTNGPATIVTQLYLNPVRVVLVRA